MKERIIELHCFIVPMIAAIILIGSIFINIFSIKWFIRIFLLIYSLIIMVCYLMIKGEKNEKAQSSNIHKSIN